MIDVSIWAHTSERYNKLSDPTVRLEGHNGSKGAVLSWDFDGSDITIFLPSHQALLDFISGIREAAASAWTEHTAGVTA